MAEHLLPVSLKRRQSLLPLIAQQKMTLSLSVVIFGLSQSGGHGARHSLSHIVALKYPKLLPLHLLGYKTKTINATKLREMTYRRTLHEQWGLKLSHYPLVTPYIDKDIAYGSNNCSDSAVLADDTKQLPEPMLVSYYWHQSQCHFTENVRIIYIIKDVSMSASAHWVKHFLGVRWAPGHEVPIRAKFGLCINLKSCSIFILPSSYRACWSYCMHSVFLYQNITLYCGWVYSIFKWYSITSAQVDDGRGTHTAV